MQAKIVDIETAVDVPSKSEMDLLHEIGSRIAAADPLHTVLARRRALRDERSCGATRVSSTCSRSSDLVLRASKTPHPDVVDRLKLRVGQGITGWVAEHRAARGGRRAARPKIRGSRSSTSCPRIGTRRSCRCRCCRAASSSGVINVQHRQPHEHTQREMQIDLDGRVPRRAPRSRWRGSRPRTCSWPSGSKSARSSIARRASCSANWASARRRPTSTIQRQSRQRRQVEEGDRRGDHHRRGSPAEQGCTRATRCRGRGCRAARDEAFSYGRRHARLQRSARAGVREPPRERDRRAHRDVRRPAARGAGHARGAARVGRRRAGAGGRRSCAATSTPWSSSPASASARCVEAVDRAGTREPFLAALRRTRVIVRGPKPAAVLRELDVPVWANAPEPNTWRELMAAVDGTCRRVDARRRARGRAGIRRLEHRAARRPPRRAGRRSPPCRPISGRCPRTSSRCARRRARSSRGEVDVVLITSGIQIVHFLARGARAWGSRRDVRRGPAARDDCVDRSVRVRRTPPSRSRAGVRADAPEDGAARPRSGRAAVALRSVAVSP